LSWFVLFASLGTNHAKPFGPELQVKPMLAGPFGQRNSMKIDLSCPACHMAGKLMDGIDKSLVEAELTDDGFFKTTCKNGHEIVAIMQNPKFELLFDLAGLALLDGYTREAISSFAVSLERFYEFFIKVAFIHNKIQQDIFVKYWSIVSKQSERQLGCFISTYMQLFNEVPALQTNNQVELRNNVVHKGYIASEQEALEYGNSIGKQIRDISKRLQDFDNEAYMSEIYYRYKQTTEKNKASNIQISTMYVPTMLSTTRIIPGFEEFELKTKLEELKSYRTYVYSDFRKKQLDDYNYGILKQIYGRYIE
jgi:hypothetical protein